MFLPNNIKQHINMIDIHIFCVDAYACKIFHSFSVRCTSNALVYYFDCRFRNYIVFVSMVSQNFNKFHVECSKVYKHCEITNTKTMTVKNLQSKVVALSTTFKQSLCIILLSRN